MKKAVHINCDLGEGGSYDAAIMSLISSCNIACSGHFGDASSITKAMQLARQHKVAVGAHPSYPDRNNFGRISLAMKEEELYASLYRQMELFYGIATKLNVNVKHIKPHGALYHDVAEQPKIARLFLDVVAQFTQEALIYASPSATHLKTGLHKDRLFIEVFADRQYKRDGKLVSRTMPNSVLYSPELVSQQVLNLIKYNRVQVVDGSWLALAFDTICFHSDSPTAVENLRYLNEILSLNEIEIVK